MKLILIALLVAAPAFAGPFEDTLNSYGRQTAYGASVREPSRIAQPLQAPQPSPGVSSWITTPTFDGGSYSSGLIQGRSFNCLTTGQHTNCR